MEHDHSYKLLFSHRRMVRDLLQGFVDERWVGEADFSTLERGNGNYVADDLRERTDDIIWHVRCGDDVVFVLIEFQSSVDRFMAVRVQTYVGLLYQDLIRASNSRELRQLPAILPIVLHSGRRRWSAASDIAELVGNAPRGLDKYRPQLRYLLIDQARYEDAELASERNFAGLLFRIESCRRRDLIPQLVGTLMMWLMDDPALDSLRRAFAVWLEKVVLARLTDTRTGNELWEKPAMLSETFDEWEKELREEGWHKGRQEGRQEGRHEGVQELLAHLLRKRFGELPESARALLRGASLDQLESWTDRVLEASNLEAIFEPTEPAPKNS